MKLKTKTNDSFAVVGFSIFGLVVSLIVTLASISADLDFTVAFLD